MTIQALRTVARTTRTACTELASAAMMDEFKNWMTTPAGRAKFSDADAQQTAQVADIVGEIAWQQLSSEHRS